MSLRVSLIGPPKIRFCRSYSPVTESTFLQLLSVDDPPIPHELDDCNDLPPLFPVLVFDYLVNNVPTIIFPKAKDPDIVHCKTQLLPIAVAGLKISVNTVHVPLLIHYAFV